MAWRYLRAREIADGLLTTYTPQQRRASPDHLIWTLRTAISVLQHVQVPDLSGAAPHGFPTVWFKQLLSTMYFLILVRTLSTAGLFIRPKDGCGLHWSGVFAAWRIPGSWSLASERLRFALGSERSSLYEAHPCEARLV